MTNKLESQGWISIKTAWPPVGIYILFITRWNDIIVGRTDYTESVRIEGTNEFVEVPIIETDIAEKYFISEHEIKYWFKLPKLPNDVDYYFG